MSEKEYTRQQFDSCSYDELTRCVRARIEWIRECKRFLDDSYCRQYGSIRATIGLRVICCKWEIRRLLVMRRVLKRSGLHNWDSRILSLKGRIA